MDAPTIPMTAWEQAAVVSLFALIFIILMGLLLKWFSSQQEKWQIYIATRDEQWQKFLDRQSRSQSELFEERNRAVVTKVDGLEAALKTLVEAVEKVATGVSCIQDDLQEHDRKAAGIRKRGTKAE